MRVFRRIVRLAALAAMTSVFAAPARAGDADLEEDDDAKTEDGGFGSADAPKPAVTIQRRTFTLAECLALADRNHPNLWAARARLAFAHGQLQEARTFPWWQFQANATAGVLPPIGGTAVYSRSTAQSLVTGVGEGYAPFFQFSVGGVLPLYTFGKIDAGNRAAEANVRVQEWDLEKFRQLVRMDVRRAYFGAMFARDARYLATEVSKNLEKALAKVKKKLRKGDTTAEEADRLRLEVYRDEINARVADADRGEQYALAALKFITGVQTDFDVPDEPLERPKTPLGPLLQYLAAARLYRPEVNQARAGVVARSALVDLARARMFPDIGVGIFASYSTAPSAIVQNNAWLLDPFNRFGFGAALGVRWNLDLLPAAARVQQAEAQLEETRALERLALGGIATEVENAYASAVEARKREEAWGKAERRSRQWISLTQDMIDLGTRDDKALIEPLRTYVNARLAHLYALHDSNITMSELARVTGWDAIAPGS